MWPAKIFLKSKFSYLLFSNPTYKTKTGAANRWDTTKSNPLGPILYDWPIWNGEQHSDHIYYTLLWHVLRFAGAFTNLTRLRNNAGSKVVCWAKPACFYFSSSILTWSVTYWAQEVTLITTTSSQSSQW